MEHQAELSWSGECAAVLAEGFLPALLLGWLTGAILFEFLRDWSLPGQLEFMWVPIELSGGLTVAALTFAAVALHRWRKRVGD